MVIKIQKVLDIVEKVEDSAREITLDEAKKNDPKYDYPTVEEGLRGMKFIDAVIESSKSSNWINI